MPLPHSHLNFPFLMILFGNDEHMASAALRRLSLRNKLVFVSVSTSLLLCPAQSGSVRADCTGTAQIVNEILKWFLTSWY